jgi:hypothetical protein
MTRWIGRIDITPPVLPREVEPRPRAIVVAKLLLAPGGGKSGPFRPGDPPFRPRNAPNPAPWGVFQLSSSGAVHLRGCAIDDRPSGMVPSSNERGPADQEAIVNTLKTVVSLAVASALSAAPDLASASTSGSIYASNSGVSLSFSYFDDDLAPYGQWVDYEPYGQCWIPANTPYGWRPYWDGHWAYTDCGWTWVSNEPWGWATYHYGRWHFDPYHGWMWVPGTVWAPSWVAWHSGNGYVGWAPLPPAAHWDVHVGLHFGGVSAIPVSNWCFVEQRHFTHSKIKYKVVNRSRNDVIYHHTRNVTRYDTWDGYPRNVGFDVATVNDWGGGKVKKMRVADVSGPRQGHGEKVRGNSIETFRPRIDSKSRKDVAVRSRGHDVPRRDQLVRGDVRKSQGSEPVVRGEGRKVQSPRELARADEVRREGRSTRVEKSREVERAREVVRERGRSVSRDVERAAPVRKSEAVRKTEARSVDRRSADVRRAEPVRRSAEKSKSAAVESRRSASSERELAAAETKKGASKGAARADSCSSARDKAAKTRGN